MLTKKVPKSSGEFICKCCNYITSRESQYVRHLTTAKHKNANNANILSIDEYTCNCGKKYKHVSSYSRHKKKCNVEEKSSNIIKSKKDLDTNTTVNADMMMKILTQNQELLMANQEFKGLILEQQNENQKQQNENMKLQSKILETESKLLEVVKEGKNITNNTNCNNKFNLNLFLNEQCKNAMNISEFIDNMVLTVDDLKNTGKLGYINGISKIFADKLKELNEHDRPMHCTDLKRETLYIKQNNEWGKESSDKSNFKTAIELVANKNLNNLHTWKEANPNHAVMDSKEDKEFVEIMTNSLGGMGTDREKNKDKIIKNVLKEVIVEK